MSRKFAACMERGKNKTKKSKKKNKKRKQEKMGEREWVNQGQKACSDVGSSFLCSFSPMSLSVSLCLCLCLSFPLSSLSCYSSVPTISSSRATSRGMGNSGISWLELVYRTCKHENRPGPKRGREKNENMNGKNNKRPKQCNYGA